jgi:hypothetical protein
MSSNVVTLRGRISSPDQRAIGSRMHALEQACHSLLDLCHPCDSPFVRRDGLSYQAAEVVHRLASRLLSQISQAAWELGLNRTLQNAGEEAFSVVSRMKEIVRELENLKSSTANEDVEPYLQAFAQESLRILNDVSHVVGNTRREPYLAGQGGTNHD